MAAKPPIKWIVAEKSTGPYASFSRRGWPRAEYKNKKQTICATISCEDDYVPARVRTGEHRELTIRVADHRQPQWKWVVLKAKAKTLAEAKEMVSNFLKKYPQLMPKEEE